MEQREHPRYALLERGWHAELIDAVGAEALGSVVNLSPGGLMLITPRRLQVDDLYQVICVAAGPDGREQRFSAGIRVLWSTPASQPGTAWAGAQIIDIDDVSRALLTALMNSNVAACTIRSD